MKVFFIIIMLFSISMSYAMMSPLKDINGDDVSFINQDSITNIYIFSKMPCCHDCFIKLDDLLSSLFKGNYKFKTYLVISCGENIIEKKININYFKEIIRYDKAYFDSDYFNNYKISATPSILICNKGIMTAIPYDSLFLKGRKINSNLIKAALK